jgi:hypothetical protein
MRHALYGNNFLTLVHLDRATVPAKPKPGAGLVRWITRRWDLVGVLALLGSSGAYGVYALTHLGL